MNWFYAPNNSTSSAKIPLTRNRSKTIYDYENDTSEQFKQTVASVNSQEEFVKEIEEFEQLPEVNEELDTTVKEEENNTATKDEELDTKDEELSALDNFAANTVPTHTYESESDINSSYLGNDYGKTQNDVVNRTDCDSVVKSPTGSNTSNDNSRAASCQHSYVDEEKIKHMLDRNLNDAAGQNRVNTSPNTIDELNEQNASNNAPPSQNKMDRTAKLANDKIVEVGNTIETVLVDGFNNNVYPHIECAGNALVSLHTKINNQVQAYQNHEKKLNQNTHVSTIYNNISMASYKGRPCKYRAYEILEKSSSACQIECNNISTKIIQSGIFIGKVNAAYCENVAKIFRNMGFNVTVGGVELSWSSAEESIEYQYVTIIPQ